MDDKFQTGVVVGKFYPFHMGHSYLIDFAKKKCEKLFVVITHKEGQEPDVNLREAWIRQLHPNVEVRRIDATNVPDWNPILWARLTMEAIGCRPSAAFSSEEYGKAWCHHMKCENVVVDLDRKKYPVSGTQVRANPYEMLDLLPAPVREYYEKKARLDSQNQSDQCS